MFGYMQFRNGADNYRTPPEFQNAAREHVAAHLAQMKAHTTINSGVKPISHTKNAISNTNSSTTQYVHSPLRQTTLSANVADSDECSSIDSGRSGCSLSPEAARSLLLAQQKSLNEAATAVSNDSQSLFSKMTYSTVSTESASSLQTLLPTDFSDYYSPDLDVARFPNGRPVFTKRPLKNWQLNDVRSLLIYPQLRPEWNGQLPVVSEKPLLRVQIIPPHLSDNLIAESLANSDIYREAKFDISFRLKTAIFIVERARRRHRQMLIDSFDIRPDQFNNENNLIGNVQYDSYFKFEWRNIIENYMLNLGIEYQCQIEFKLKMSKLTKQKKSDTPLHRALLSGKTITENDKLAIWKDIQVSVHNRLNMDDW